MSSLETKIESLIFCSPKPIKIDIIQKAFAESESINYKKKEIKDCLDSIFRKYNNNNFSFELVESGGGFQFLTKKEFSRLNEILLKQQSKRRLSISHTNNLLQNLK